MQFGALINYSDKNYNFIFQEQDFADESTFNIEGHHVKLNVSTDAGESLPADISEKLKGLQKNNTTLKNIYAVVLGVNETALNLNVNETFATFDSIKKLAFDHLKTTKVSEGPPIRFQVFQSDLEQKLRETIKKHDTVVAKLKALESDDKADALALNVLTLGALPALKAFRQSRLQATLRDYKVEIIANLYKKYQVETFKSSEEARKAQPELDLALEQALWIDHIGYIRELLQAGGKLKTKHISIAVGLLSHRIMDLLYKEGHHVDDVKLTGNWTLLHLACGNISKPLDAIKFLLEYKADPEKKNDEGVTPVHLALENNLPIETIQLLLSKVQNLDVVDNKGRSLLVSAIDGQKSNDPFMLKLLLEKGIQPNTKDKDGRTPVNEAIIKLGFKSVPAIKELIKAGAVVTTRNKGGGTPLHDAASYSVMAEKESDDDGSLARFLIKSGASPLAVDDNGFTPLHNAVRYSVNPRNDQTIRALLEAGGDINAQDKDGNTPLHYAALMGHVDQVKLLLSKGANRNIRNQFGDTPAGQANTAGILWPDSSREIIDLLGKVS